MHWLKGEYSNPLKPFFFPPSVTNVGRMIKVISKERPKSLSASVLCVYRIVSALLKQY